ncbi:MAG: SAM-dependent methyltransferase [Clostridia bacterium]|nr:SAM-dependent methyltransferase [Clostridia bacterium]
MDAVHNRKKNYLINEGEDVPALKDLGVFTAENKIAAKMHDKFRQINRFIETVDDVMSEDSGEITVLDFGCGKSYLTFLLYHYLTVKKGLKTRVIGYDIKEDVVENCNKIAKRYGYSSLEFVHADVKKDKLYDRQIDMVVSLHACDTATDFALDYAIKRSAKYIFSVPCCQHEINAQIRRGGDYDIFLTHGLLKERFSALLTDAIRAEVLENAGYRVDCMEFVGFDASPKNLMLRAVKTGAAAEDNTKQKALLNKYGVKQTLVQLREGTALTATQEEKNG